MVSNNYFLLMETTVAISLPKEIWNLILGYCKVELAKRLQFALVCKSWKSTVVKLTTEVNLRDKSGRHLDKITNQFPYLEKIILPKFGDGLSSLTCLKNLPRLRSLSLINETLRLVDKTINDFNIYAALTQLTHLTIGESSQEDVLKLSTLTNLVSLDLRNLTSKSLTNNSMVMMKDMTQLAYFCTPRNVWWDSGYSEKISHLTNLKTLIVERPGSASIGLDMLSNLVQLEHVDITFGHRQQEIEHIRHWTNLTSLKLSNAHLSNESFCHLSSLQKLRHFILFQGQCSSTAFLTVAQWPKLQQITFDGVGWPIDAEEGVNPYAEEEMPYNPKDDRDDEYIESEQTRTRWDLLSSMTHLTSLKRLIGLPYHRALDTRIKFFPQSLTSLSVEGLYDESKVFFQSLLQFTNLAALMLDYNSRALSNDTIDIISHLTALRTLQISSCEYNGDYYQIWKSRKEEDPTLKPDPSSLTFPNLSISSFARLTQLTSLYVSQDPFEEEELWTLTALRKLQKITLGWRHFNTKNFIDFIGADLPLDQ